MATELCKWNTGRVNTNLFHLPLHKMRPVSGIPTAWPISVFHFTLLLSEEQKKPFTKALLFIVF
jgi:hypothetical protein